MASYGVNVLHDGTPNGWTMTILRGPTTAASGGTNLDTTTAGTGFQQAASTSLMTNPTIVLERAMQMIRADRSKNGD